MRSPQSWGARGAAPALTLRIRLVAAFMCVLLALACAPGAEAAPTPTPTPDANLASQAYVFYMGGDLFYKQKDWQRARDAFTQALALYRRAGDRLNEGFTLEYIAWTYDSEEQYAQAADYYQQAIAVYQELGQTKAAGTALNYLGDVYDHQGRYSRALEAYQQALPLRQQAGDRQGEAQTLENIGYSYENLARYGEALDFFNQALPVWRELGLQLGEARTLTLMGETYRYTARYDEALAVFRQALAIRQAIHNRGDEGLTFNQIGYTYLQTGDYAKALQNLQQALAVWQETGDTKRQALALRNIALVYDRLALDEKALEVSQQALAIERQAADHSGEALTLRRMGTLNLALGRTSEAVSLYQQAVAVLQQNNLSADLGAFVHDLGLAYQQLGSQDEALETFQEALDWRRESSDRTGEGETLHSIGTAHAALGQADKSLEAFQQALTIRREMGDRSGEAATLSAIGSLLEERGDLDQALEYDRQAITASESLVAAASLEELKAGLVEQSADVYERAVRLLLRLNRPADAFAMSERARARIFLDQIGNTHLDVRAGSDAQLVQQEQALRQEAAALDATLRQEQAKPGAERNTELVQSLSVQIAAKQKEYTDLLTRMKLSNPEYASLVSVSPLGLADVQKLLDKDTTLVSYFVISDTVLAFVVTRDSLHTVEIAASFEDVQAAVSEFRDFASLDEVPPPSLVRLYTWLVAPLKPYLTTPLIGIIPHRILHYLPFAALSDGQRYLGADCTLFSLPSASALPFVQQKRKAGSGAVLVMAQGQAEGLPTLHNADQEAQAVAEVFGVRALTGRAATKTALLAAASQARIMHVAAHGQLNAASPLFSRLVLAADGESDGSLTVGDVYGLDLKQADLVVLSACQTQLGAQGRGDDIVGLTRAFIYAGSPTVVASLWSVDDETTRLLMTSFYRHLKQGLLGQGMSKAEALRAAQAEVRATYPHPYYWAAFVLTGDAGESSKGISAVVVLAGLAVIAALAGAWLLLVWRRTALR